MSAIYILMTTTSVKSVVPLSSSDERCYVRAKDYCYYFCLLSSRLQGVLLVTFMRPSSQPAAPSRGVPWYFKSFRWCWLDAEQETLGRELFVLKEVEVVTASVQSSGIKAFPKVDFKGLTDLTAVACLMALVFLLLLNILGCPALRHLSPPVICDLWVCTAIQPAQVRYLFCGYLAEYISRLLTYIIISIFVLFYFATKSFPYWTMVYTYFLIFYFVCVYVLKCDGGDVPWHTRGGQRTANRSRFSTSTVWVSLPPCGSRLKALKLQGLAAGTFSYCIISLALHGPCFLFFF